MTQRQIRINAAAKLKAQGMNPSDVVEELGKQLTEGTKQKKENSMTTRKSSDKVTIESVALMCLRAGKGSKETLAAVLKVFPGAKTTMKCIYYYASQNDIPLRQGAKADPKQLKALLKEIA